MEKLMKKVDSMDEAERDHLRQLLREKKQDDESGKMEWMYKQNKPDTEDYLLGRRIDKHMDKEEKKESELDKDVPGATFTEVMAKRADLDMQTKMREDPLYAIRKKEEEARRRLLENPIKMKQLQKVLQRRAEEEKKKKKKKKKSKHKKRHGSDDSDSSADDDLVQKYLAIVAQKKQISKAAVVARTLDEGSDSEAKRSRHHKSKHSKHNKRHSSSDSSNSDVRKSQDGTGSHRRKSSDGDLVEELRKHIRTHSDEEEDRETPKAYGLLVKDGEQRLPVSRKRSTSRSPRRSKRSASHSLSPERVTKTSRSPKSRRSRSRSPRRGRHRSPDRRRSRSPRSWSPDRRRSRSKSPVKRRSPPKKAQPKKKLSAEEMEKRREEMMEDAKWRDDQRITNIERYRKEDAKEKEQLKKQMGKEASFISPLMSDHAEHSTVEDRLKRNRYNLQRTKVQMDKSFTKK